MTTQALAALKEARDAVERSIRVFGNSMTAADQCAALIRDHADTLLAALEGKPVSCTQPVYAMAYRLLWLAFVWNDHNFEDAHIEARDTALEFGITSFDEANAWLEKQRALVAEPENQP